LNILVIPLRGLNLPTLLRNGLGSFLEATPVRILNLLSKISQALFSHPIIIKLGHCAWRLLPLGLPTQALMGSRLVLLGRLGPLKRRSLGRSVGGVSVPALPCVPIGLTKTQKQGACSSYVASTTASIAGYPAA